MKPAPDFDPKAAARKLLRVSRSGALATLMAGAGDPYCSLVNVATLADGAPVLLISRLAIHTRNILADPRVSLMLDERRHGDPLQGARIMLSGTAQLSADPEAKRRYLDRQPDAAMYADFADFGFYVVDITAAHLVAGFGRIVDLAPSDILLDLSGSRGLIESETEVIAHMNADHADAVRLYATRLLAAPDCAWRCVGCDPDGLDLQYEHEALRLDFPHRIDSPGALRQVLRELAERARAS